MSATVLQYPDRRAALVRRAIITAVEENYPYSSRRDGVSAALRKLYMAGATERYEFRDEVRREFARLTDEQRGTGRTGYMGLL